MRGQLPLAELAQQEQAQVAAVTTVTTAVCQRTAPLPISATQQPVPSWSNTTSETKTLKQGWVGSERWAEGVIGIRGGGCGCGILLI